MQHSGSNPRIQTVLCNVASPSCGRDSQGSSLAMQNHRLGARMCVSAAVCACEGEAREIKLCLMGAQCVGLFTAVFVLLQCVCASISPSIKPQGSSSSLTVEERTCNTICSILCSMSLPKSAPMD